MFWFAVASYFIVGLAFMFFFYYLVGRHKCAWHTNSALPCVFHFELELSAIMSPAVWPMVLFMWICFGGLWLIGYPIMKLGGFAMNLGKKHQ
jgi:hypothetical protein